MAEMSGTKPKSAAKGRLMGINIELKGNGFEVTKRYEPTPSKNGLMSYTPEKVADSMVFTEPGECITYLEKCLGEREAAAHEASEKKEY